MNKRRLLCEEDTNERKRSKHEEWNERSKYGHGVAWLRGEIIGKGSFGCVFLGILKKPKSKYSSYPPIMAVKSAEVSVSGSIQKERQVLDNIRGAPNVIKCFGEEITNGENGQMVYNLLLEYGSGGTLAGLIKKSGGKGLLELEVRRHARAILRGLGHIHRCRYVHCDLKPDNVLLVSNSRDGGFNAKIGDLGLAKRARKSKKSKLGPYWRGTPMYLSPETVVDGVQEPPSDIWAVGCIVLEMLTGKPPWDSPDSDSDDVFSRIGNENESPCIPDTISIHARSFLKGCLSRKVMFRLTADMLLDHPFLKGLVEDDVSEVRELHEVLDINSISSSLVFSEAEDDDDDEAFWLSSYSEGSSYISSSWCEGDGDHMENEVDSCLSEEALNEEPKCQSTITISTII